jgi:hypothetical protein
MTDDLHTDGNHLAGLLTEFLGADLTTMVRRCHSCQAENPLAAHLAYRGAGAVLRCPACGDVAVLVGECGADVVLQWRGTYRATRPA